MRALLVAETVILLVFQCHAFAWTTTKGRWERPTTSIHDRHLLSSRKGISHSTHLFTRSDSRLGTGDTGVMSSSRLYYSTQPAPEDVLGLDETLLTPDPSAKPTGVASDPPPQHLSRQEMTDTAVTAPPSQIEFVLSSGLEDLLDLEESLAAPKASVKSIVVAEDLSPPDRRHQETIVDSAAATAPSSRIESILSSYAGPRLILAAVAFLYGTNFPLGSLMADELPASAATSARMVLAALVLAPFVPRISPKLRWPAVLAGCFVSLGYVSQSIALVDSPPATVSFLGAATVLVCPFLEWVVDGRPMSFRDAPQVWFAALLCLSGVAALELMDPTAIAAVTSMEGANGIAMRTGDAFALLQAVGFGTGCYMSERMMREEPDQALPVTAVLVATTAAASMAWSIADGWMADPSGQRFALPQLFLDPSLSTAAAAVAWTGIVSTSLNFYVEIVALGRVPSAEASVILATEPLWAAFFGAMLLHEQFGMNDYVGGMLVILACLVNTLNPDEVRRWLRMDLENNS